MIFKNNVRSCFAVESHKMHQSAIMFVIYTAAGSASPVLYFTKQAVVDKEILIYCSTYFLQQI